jgi:hypothetical protein
MDIYNAGGNSTMTRRINLGRAILSLNPLARFTMEDNDYATIVWQPDHQGVQPTQAEAEAELTRLTAEEPNRQARSNRQRAFEVEADPLFFKVQRGEATQQEWLDAVQAIRDRYPYQ